MLHVVKKVEHIQDYKLKLTFQNNEVKIVDLEHELCGPMFEPLKDIKYFKLVKTDGHTIIWPNDTDFCPDVLYEIGENIPKQEKPAKRRRQRADIKYLTSHAMQHKKPKTI